MSLGFKLFTKKCEKNAEKVSSPPPIEIKRRKEKKNGHFLQGGKTFIVRSHHFCLGERRRRGEVFCASREKKRPRQMSGVRTRAQRRRIGERNLWGLIVKCDGICFTHVLPRLSATDIKFLYGVNKETRKLVKRSSRAGDLKKKFNIGEMSSISTLEVAWEHYPWARMTTKWKKRWTNHISATKLLKRISSSCSSGYERRKSVSGMKRRLMWL